MTIQDFEEEMKKYDESYFQLLKLFSNPHIAKIIRLPSENNQESIDEIIKNKEIFEQLVKYYNLIHS